MNIAFVIRTKIVGVAEPKSDKIATAKLSRFITTELSKDLPRGEDVILNRA